MTRTWYGELLELKPRKMEETADFSQQIASRNRKFLKSGRDNEELIRTKDHKIPDKNSTDSKEEYINSLASRIRKEADEDKSEEDSTDNRSKMSSGISSKYPKKSKRTGKTYQERPEAGSDGEESSSLYSPKNSHLKKKMVIKIEL